MIGHVTFDKVKRVRVYDMNPEDIIVAISERPNDAKGDTASIMLSRELAKDLLDRLAAVLYPKD